MVATTKQGEGKETKRREGPLGNGPSQNIEAGFCGPQAAGTAFEAPRGNEELDHATTPSTH